MDPKAPHSTDSAARDARGAIQVELEVARRPHEAEVSEGNIVENPIFVLTNKEARPVDADGKIRPEDYTRTKVISRETEKGVLVERSVTISAHQKYGFPTMFAYRLLVAIIDAGRQQGWTSPVVRVTRHELARRLGFARPNKGTYEDIETALNAMASMRLEFRHTWHDTKAQGRHPKVASDGLLHSFAFDDGRKRKAPPPDDADPGENYVRIGDLVFKSIRDGYYNGVDLDYMNALKHSPLAVRLYAYLTKKNLRRASYSENLVHLASKLNLKKKAPSAIADALVPALTLLSSPVQVGALKERRRFIDSFEIAPDRSKVEVCFFVSG